MQHLTYLCVTGLLTLTLHLSALAGEIIPAEDFFRLPEKTDFKISPSGHCLSYIRSNGGTQNLVCYDRKTGDSCSLLKDSVADILSYYWITDEKIVCLYRTATASGVQMQLLDLKNDRIVRLDQTPISEAKVIAVPLIPAAELIVALKPDGQPDFDLYTVDIARGEMKLYYHNSGKVSDWLFDRNGQLRLTITSDDDRQIVSYSAGDGQAWRVVATLAGETTFIPAFFAEDNQLVYVYTNRNRDRVEVVLFDPESGQEIRTVAGNGYYDFTSRGLADVPVTCTAPELYALRLTTWYTLSVYNAAKIQQVADMIKKRKPGYLIEIVAADQKAENLIVRLTSDRQKGAYYLYNGAEGQLQYLAAEMPWLPEKSLAETRLFHFKARDGQIMAGYLTVPREHRRKKLPLVVIPAVNCRKRCGWEFDEKIQFLANRGYAVLKLDLRGSAGYGHQYQQVDYPTWLSKLPDDLTDGLAALNTCGLVDVNRVTVCSEEIDGSVALCSLQDLRHSSKQTVTVVQSTDHKSMAVPLDIIQGPLQTTNINNYDLSGDQLIGVIVNQWTKKGMNVRYLSLPRDQTGAVEDGSLLKIYTAVEQFLK